MDFSDLQISWLVSLKRYVPLNMIPKSVKRLSIPIPICGNHVRCTMYMYRSFHKVPQKSRFRLYSGFRLASRSPLAARRFVATTGDHRLLLQSYSSQHPRRIGFITERHRIQLSAVCRCEQSGGVTDLLAKRCLPLGFPSAASSACAVVQKSPSKLVSYTDFIAFIPPDKQGGTRAIKSV